MTVTMIPVKSSNIAKIGYDALALQLNVEFKNGKTFGYKYVSSRDFDKLICAESVGKYFNSFIKPDKVAFEILDTKEEYTSKDEVITEHTLDKVAIADKTYTVLQLDGDGEISVDACCIEVDQFKGECLDVWKERDDGFFFVYCERLEVGYWVSPKLITIR